MNPVEEMQRRAEAHDPRDPDFTLAMFLDRSLPFDETAKAAFLIDQGSRSRQFLLPLIRPFARTLVVLVQLVKLLIPNRFTSSALLHRLLTFSLKTWVSPRANLLIMRHFHIGSELLAFIAANAGVTVPLAPLRPTKLDDVRAGIFLQHDLNIFNFVIALNQALRERDLRLEPRATLDLSAISTDGFGLATSDMPDGPTNFLDLQSAIELFTPVYQAFLTDNDFWRASNSLQLDETIAVYVATLLGDPTLVALVNNRHPMVPLSTLRAGFRLVLHGLAAESLHAVLRETKLGTRRAKLLEPLA